MHHELDMTWSGRGLFEVLSRNVPAGTYKITKNLKIADVPEGNRTEHLPNASLERI
jgi:hypothetical protein